MYIDTGTDGSGGPGRMSVDPGKLMQLKQGLDDEIDRITAWLFENRNRLHYIDAPGRDPCSRDSMEVMGQNGQTALDKCDAYARRLTEVARKLHESAVSYGLTEEHNAATFRQEPS